MLIRMKRQDLIELYQLTQMYARSYRSRKDPEMAGLLSDIKETYARQCKGEAIEDAHNPRGAGRKPVYTQGDNDRIIGLKKEGLSLRAIAKAAGCSLGHVQDVLHSQNVC